MAECIAPTEFLYRNHAPDVESRHLTRRGGSWATTHFGRFAENLAGSSDAGGPVAQSRIRKQRPVHQPNV